MIKFKKIITMASMACLNSSGNESASYDFKSDGVVLARPEIQLKYLNKKLNEMQPTSLESETTIKESQSLLKKMNDIYVSELSKKKQHR